MTLTTSVTLLQLSSQTTQSIFRHDELSSVQNQKRARSDPALFYVTLVETNALFGDPTCQV